MGNAQSHGAGSAAGKSQLHNSAEGVSRNIYRNTTEWAYSQQVCYARPRFTSASSGTSENGTPLVASPIKIKPAHRPFTADIDACPPSAEPVDIDSGQALPSTATVGIPEIPKSSFGVDFSNFLEGTLVADQAPNARQPQQASSDIIITNATSTPTLKTGTATVNAERHAGKADFFTSPFPSPSPPEIPTRNAPLPTSTFRGSQKLPIFSLGSDDSRPPSQASSVHDSPDAEDTMFAGVLGDTNASEEDLKLSMKKNKRTSLFRTLSTKDVGERSIRTKSVFVAGSSMKDMLARRATTIGYDKSIADFYSSKAGNNAAHSWLIAGNRTSRNFDMTSYEAQRLLNLNEIPFDNMKFEQAFSDNYSPTGDVSNDKATETISRVASDLSFLAPSRRRSVAQTPGVATRGPPSPLFPQRPSHSADETRSFGQIESIESEPVEIAMSAVPGQLTADWQQETHERAATPCESHYMQLGGIKFGSLRIMNGSPDVSPRSSMAIALHDGSEDTTSAHKLNDSLSMEAISFDKPMSLKSLERSQLGVSSLSLTPTTIQLISTSPSIETPVTLAFENSPKEESFVVDETKDNMISLDLPIVDLFSDLNLDFGSFSLSPPGSPKNELLTTSKPEFTDNDVLENDIESEFSLEILCVRPDISAHPSQSTDTDISVSTQTISRSTSGAVSSPASEYSQFTTKRSINTDSGYGSNMSIRSSQSSVLARGDKHNLVRSATGSQSRRRGTVSLGPSSLERSQSSASSARLPSLKFSTVCMPESSSPVVSNFPNIQESVSVASTVTSSPKSLVSKHSRDLVSGSPPRMRNSSPVAPKVPHVALLATRNASIKKSRRASSYYSPSASSVMPPQQSQVIPATPVPVHAPKESTTSSRGGDKLGKFKKLLSSTGFRSSFYGSNKDEAPAVIINSGSSSASPASSRKAKDLKSAELLHPSVKRLIRGQPSKATLQTIMSVGSFENALTPIEGQVTSIHVQDQSSDPVIPKTPICEEVQILSEPANSVHEANTKLRKRRSFLNDPFSNVLSRSKSLKKAVSSSTQSNKNTTPRSSRVAPQTPEIHPQRPDRYRARSFKSDKTVGSSANQANAIVAQKLAFDKALADLSEERKKTINPMLGRMTDGLSRCTRKRSTTDPTRVGASPKPVVATAPASVVSQPQSPALFRGASNSNIVRTYSCGLFQSEASPPESLGRAFCASYVMAPAGAATHTDWSSAPPSRRRSLVSLRISNFWSDTPQRKTRDGSESPKKTCHSRASSRDGRQIETTEALVQARPVRVRLTRAYSDTQGVSKGMTSPVPKGMRERPSSAVAAFSSSEAQQAVTNSTQRHSSPALALPIYQRQSPAQGTSTHHSYVQSHGRPARRQNQQSRPPSCAPKMHQLVDMYATQQQEMYMRNMSFGHIQQLQTPRHRGNQTNVHARKRSWSADAQPGPGYRAPYRTLHSYTAAVSRNTPSWGYETR
ncbi:uncharacterized protein BROUX77_005040 [Berkeleyomyces rouxiae]|uniref:uncharacterized protein n=1 Tax=Berkeleyomyces rouxiae TaxID=2035830 RepID=UPI003B80080F